MVGPSTPRSVALGVASGRVLSADVVATTMVPPFDRAAMDGYAVRSEDTLGACDERPVPLRRSGVARPCRAFNGEVGPGFAVQVATGAPLPAGADAVVPVEDTETDGMTVWVCALTRFGCHVGLRGEDIAAGTTVLSAGRALRPQDLGILSALGCRAIEVVARRSSWSSRATSCSLVARRRGHQIADMSSVMLSALIARDGGLPQVVGPVPDDPRSLRETISDAAADADALLITGGSSTGPEDHVPNVVADLGELAIHGVALRPAGPTGIGRIGMVPVFLMPGNPVISLGAYDLFAGRLIRRLGGRSPSWPYRSVDWPLAEDLASCTAASIIRGCGSLAALSSLSPPAVPLGYRPPPVRTALCSSLLTALPTPPGK